MTWDGATIDPSSASLVGAVVHAGPRGRSRPGRPLGVTFPPGPMASCPRRRRVADERTARCRRQPGRTVHLGRLVPAARSPGQLEGEEGSRTWRRSFGRSAVRKAHGRGAVIGVHVVDVAALSALGRPVGRPRRGVRCGRIGVAATGTRCGWRLVTTRASSSAIGLGSGCRLALRGPLDPSGRRARLGERRRHGVRRAGVSARAPLYSPSPVAPPSTPGSFRRCATIVEPGFSRFGHVRGGRRVESVEGGADGVDEAASAGRAACSAAGSSL